uniref:phage major capsid protein n=1 Tax=Rummeliibacillus suwonensis TaxID=1306154 RepID=UPI00289DA916
MNRQLLLALQKRNKERLTELRGKLEDPELRAADLESIQTEIEDITKQLQEIADELANDEEGDEGKDGSEGTDEGDEDRDGEPGGDGGEGTEEGAEGEEGRSAANPEKRSAALGAIKTALSTRNAKSTKQRDKEVRSAFANFVVGKISESEARSLGVEAGNGSVTIPEVIASEIITYAQEENLLRKYGTVVRTAGDVKYPVLVKKADANVRKKERGAGDEIPETEIEFDEILLDPAEFDALATVTKKLLKMTNAPIEQIVIDELKKAYVRKETNYMFKGNDAGNENPGALEKKAVAYYESE